MNKWWWKIVCIVLLVYTFTAGLLFNNIPRIPNLEETIRNLYFHVCMWFAMMFLFIASVVFAIKYLRTNNLHDDIRSREFAVTGIVFGLLGYATGTIWMSFTWVDPNRPAYESFSEIAKEPKLIGAAIALLIYFAYLVLRDSISDLDKKARIGAVYNIFAFAFLFPAIWIIPRLMPSLHPGGVGPGGEQSGSPALDFKSSSPQMRVVFYPAIIGWTLLGFWITSLKVRMRFLKEKKIGTRTMSRKLTILTLLLLIHFFALAQNNKVEMADTMRSNGKIYVVVAVIIAIFAGIILYLVRLDRKLTKLEKNL